MIYLTVDGMLSGTGIRDSVEGGYISPKELGLSSILKDKISKWLSQYEDAHYNQYEDKAQIVELDAEGLDICKMLKEEIPDSKINYYSDAEMKERDCK